MKRIELAFSLFSLWELWDANNEWRMLLWWVDGWWDDDGWCKMKWSMSQEIEKHLRHAKFSRRQNNQKRGSTDMTTRIAGSRIGPSPSWFFGVFSFLCFRVLLFHLNSQLPTLSLITRTYLLPLIIVSSVNPQTSQAAVKVKPRQYV